MYYTEYNCIIALLIHVHQDMTDELDLRTVANEFIALNKRRKCAFGFLKISYHLEKSVFSKLRSTQTDANFGFSLSFNFRPFQIFSNFQKHFINLS